ncbi:hypothetical protein ACRAWD_24615 [Caulobacter segnis]
MQALGGRDPLNAAWPARFAYAEEIYQYSDYDPGKVRVLQALDFTEMALRGVHGSMPITWTRRQIGQAVSIHQSWPRPQHLGRPAPIAPNWSTPSAGPPTARPSKPKWVRPNRSRRAGAVGPALTAGL